jgi:hypothetical protein
MSSAAAVVITFAIIFVLWVLFCLFVKKDYSGVWVVDEKENMYFKHNRFTNTIKIYDLKDKVLYAKGKVINDVIITESGKSKNCLVYDKKTDTFFILTLIGKDGRKTKEDEIKKGVMTPELALLIPELQDTELKQ